MFKFKGFISYSHRDTKFAVWLHRALERYAVPQGFQGLRNNSGAVIETRLGRFFRDRDELNAAPDLSESLHAALDGSENLIVVCSPSSAKSAYVDNEIATFQGLGRGSRIYALIVAGEPHASAYPGQEQNECFPPTLRGAGIELIAADARTSGDGKGRAFVKLLAGLLDVDFDVLYQRERRRARQRLMMWVGSSVAAISAFVVIGWVAYERNQDAVAKTQVTLHEAHANALLTAQDLSLEADHDNALNALMSQRLPAGSGGDLRGFAWRWLTQPYRSYDYSIVVDGSLSSLAIAPDQVTIAIANGSPLATFWNAQTGKRVAEMIEKRDKITKVEYPASSPLGFAALQKNHSHLTSGFRVFDAPAGALPGTLIEMNLDSVAPTGKYLRAAESISQPGRLFRLEANRQLASVPTAPVYGAYAWSADGNLVARSRGSLVDVVRLADGATISSLDPGEVLRIQDLEFSPRDVLVAVGTREDWQQRVHVFNLSTSSPTFSLDAPSERSSPLIAIRVSPDGKRGLAFFGKSTTEFPEQRSVVLCWDMASGKVLFSLDEKATGFATAAEFSPNSEVLVTGGRDLAIRAWNSETGAPLHLIGIHHGSQLRKGEAERRHSDGAVVDSSVLLNAGIKFLRFAADGSLLVSGGAANSYVRIWSMNWARENFALPHPIYSSNPAAQLAVRSSPRELLSVLTSPSGEQQSEVIVSILGGPQEVDRSIRADNAIRWSMSEDGSRLAALLSDESVNLYAMAEPSSTPVSLPAPPEQGGGTQQESFASLDFARAVMFSPDGRWLAASKGRRTLLRRESDVATVLTGRAPFAFSRTGATFLNTDRCEAINVWDTASSRLRASLPVNGACPSLLALSPDGNLALAILPGGVGELLGGRPTARLWNLATKRSWVLQDYSDRNGPVAVFAPDSRTLATVARDGSIHLWDPQLGRRLMAIADGNDRVRSLAFSADGLSLFALDAKRIRAFRTRPEDESELTVPTNAADHANAVFSNLKDLGGHR